jgi:hypothetical protein
VIIGGVFSNVVFGACDVHMLKHIKVVENNSTCERKISQYRTVPPGAESWEIMDVPLQGRSRAKKHDPLQGRSKARWKEAPGAEEDVRLQEWRNHRPLQGRSVDEEGCLPA